MIGRSDSCVAWSPDPAMASSPMGREGADELIAEVSPFLDALVGVDLDSPGRNGLDEESAHAAADFEKAPSPSREVLIFREHESGRACLDGIHADDLRAKGGFLIRGSRGLEH